MKDTYLNSLFDAKQEDLKNESFVYDKDFNHGHIDFKVLITQENEFYNIYILNDYFKKEPMNTLNEQIPKDSITIEDITNNMFLELKAIEFYLWFKYGNPNKDDVLSFHVEVLK